MDRTEIIQGTLDWCNERRKEQGMVTLSDLPLGKRFDGSSCPCGKATGLYVGYSDYYERYDFDADMPYKRLGFIPICVGTFANQFDRGEFPEYEEVCQKQ
jgi:hypothetical protein